ncbi:hypothetical protein GCM10007276_33060 [Agaricicola taiwanensis]|uniref:VWFA domain-containing protein n=1 Tax=Agaricicola taiwanensis TaxID=591372 RepID=A0A8J2YMP0_9RHOB|nr:hypothetical protein GCM10007276_33060 [Agaricicola taiwanensis]
MILALAGVAVTTLSVLTLDYTRAIALEARLQAAADAAVLNALHMDSADKDFAKAAEDFFYAQLEEDDRKAVLDFSSRTEVRDRLLNLVIEFRANLTGSFFEAFGYGDLILGGNATATMGPPSGLGFHFILDVSDSMGLAATEEARVALRNATINVPLGSCEFACHTAVNFTIARDIDVPLRIDVARAGIERMIGIATTDYADRNYTYSVTAISNHSVNVIETTADARQVLSSLADIDVGFGMGNTDANSWFNISLPQTAAWLDLHPSEAGRDVVVLVTDGVQSENRTTDENLVKPLDLAYCEMLKRNGRKLAIIYTEYLPIPGDHVYEHRVRFFRDQIEPNLRACASTGLLLIGSNSGDLTSVFEDMFHLVNRALYLSK